jgi:hypothetical protein
MQLALLRDGELHRVLLHHAQAQLRVRVLRVVGGRGGVPGEGASASEQAAVRVTPQPCDASAPPPPDPEPNDDDDIFETSSSVFNKETHKNNDNLRRYDDQRNVFSSPPKRARFDLNCSDVFITVLSV